MPKVFGFKLEPNNDTNPEEKPKEKQKEKAKEEGLVLPGESVLSNKAENNESEVRP